MKAWRPGPDCSWASRCGVDEIAWRTLNRAEKRRMIDRQKQRELDQVRRQEQEVALLDDSAVIDDPTAPDCQSLETLL